MLSFCRVTGKTLALICTSSSCAHQLELDEDVVEHHQTIVATAPAAVVPLAMSPFLLPLGEARPHVVPHAQAPVGSGVVFYSMTWPAGAGSESARVFVLEAKLPAATLHATRVGDRGKTTSEFALQHHCDAAINAARFAWFFKSGVKGNGDAYNPAANLYDMWGWAWGGRSDVHRMGEAWGDSHEGYRSDWEQSNSCGDHDSRYYFGTWDGVPQIGDGFPDSATLGYWEKYAEHDRMFPEQPDLLVTAWRRIVENGRVGMVQDERCGDLDDQKAKYDDRYARTAIGIKADGTVVLVVVEHNDEGVQGLTIPQLAELRGTRLGAEDALALDVGGSASMYVRGAGLVNSPKNGKSERPVANHIGINCRVEGEWVGRASRCLAPDEEPCQEWAPPKLPSNPARQANR